MPAHLLTAALGGVLALALAATALGACGLQPNVATAAPGDPGFNGGRWRVHALQFADHAAAVAQFEANGSGTSTPTRRSQPL